MLKKVIINNNWIFVIVLSACLFCTPKALCAACSTQTPTPSSEYGFLWGTAKVEGENVNIGDEVRAFVDSVEVNGGCVGFFRVNESGYYGGMPIYEDDPTTPEKDGVKSGDIIYFKICHNGAEGQCVETYEWDSPELAEFNLSIPACELPIVNFTSDETIGCSPLEVQFTNISSNADSYSWDFGDGGTSIDISPSHSYSTAGTYTVTLVATNVCGNATKTATITVNNKPKAGFTSDETIGCSPLEVQFTNTSSNADSYSWDFGDGSTSTDASPSHSYSTAGTYTVSLTATNVCGNTTKTATITVSNKIKADFTADPTGGCSPLEVQFTNISSNADSYSWDFGDGASSTEESPFHTYDTGGIYTVTLIAKNACGDSKSTKEISVNYTLKGWVKDQNDQGIFEAKVYLFNDPSIYELTDEEGRYDLCVGNELWDGNTPLNAFASVRDYVTSEPEKISDDPDNYTFKLILETKIRAEFRKGESCSIGISSEPEKFSGNSDELSVLDQSIDPNGIKINPADLAFSNGSWTYIYPDTNVRLIKLCVFADTTEDKNTQAGYRAKKIFSYNLETGAKTEQSSVKNSVGSTFDVPTTDEEDCPDIEVLVPPNSLDRDGEIIVEILDTNKLDVKYPDMINGSNVIIVIDLEGASLTKGSYVELSMPYDPNMIIDPNTDTKVDPDDMGAQLNAFEEQWLKINHFKDESALISGIGSTIPPTDILSTSLNGNNIHYVRFRLWGFSLIGIGTSSALPSATSKSGSNGGDGDGGCFIECLFN